MTIHIKYKCNTPYINVSSHDIMFGLKYFSLLKNVKYYHDNFRIRKNIVTPTLKFSKTYN